MLLILLPTSDVMFTQYWLYAIASSYMESENGNDAVNMYSGIRAKWISRVSIAVY
jgi:hypothetical protein